MKRHLAVVLFGTSLVANCGGGSSQSSPPLMVMTASLPNGTSELPYTQTIEASGGVAPFSWTVSSGRLPHNLALISSTTSKVTISGTPDTAAQGVAFTIKVTDSANQSATQSYTVSVLLEPDGVTITPSGLGFNAQLVGTASPKQTDTLTNTGNLELVINSVSITGANGPDFNESSTCGSSLAAGANCTISVTFTPSLIGPRSASITITDNTMGSPRSFSLNGVGVSSGPDATLSATSVTFPNESVGTTSPTQSITLSNYGTAVLNIANIAASSNFDASSNCASPLASLGNCAISVSFAPNSTGALNGTVSITDNAINSPQTASLNGFALPSTDIFTGICFGGVFHGAPNQCGIAQDTAQCPVGQLAKTPTTRLSCS